MLHSPTPWVGLAALIAMFVLPFLPAWLFEGPTHGQALASPACLWSLQRPLDRRPQMPIER